MTLSIKDPGSAITHFIGMLLAAAASTPLLMTAARHNGGHSVLPLAVFALSMILLYGASTVYHTLNISEKINRLLRKIDQRAPEMERIKFSTTMVRIEGIMMLLNRCQALAPSRSAAS